jgi:restriction system protein
MWESFMPPEPRGVGKILGGERLHQQQVARARRAFEDARSRWAQSEEQRGRQLAQRKKAYEERVGQHEAKVAAYNAEVDRFAAAVADAEPASVVEYFAMVLGNSVYPDDFPQHFRLAYLPHQKHLLIEYHLPPVEVIPVVKEYRYDRVRDDLTAVPRDEAEVRRRYVEVIAQVSLRTVHEVIEADRGELVRRVSFNGIVETIDRRTGRFVAPCLVSVQADRETFTGIELRRVDPVACLRYLRGELSGAPDDLAAVDAKIDFDRDADLELTEEYNVLADLDERPNLMTLDEQGWEEQLTDLFAVMGLEMGPATRIDGGTRWQAVDPRPIFGGPVVVHAARTEPADAAVIRSVADAVTEAGAAKGILISLGGIEPEAYEAAAGRPLELLDGPALIAMFANYSGLQMRVQAERGPDKAGTDPHRVLVGEMPVLVRDGSEVSLIVTVALNAPLDAVSRSTPMKPWPIPAGGSPVTIVAHASTGLIPMSPEQQVIQVPEESDAEPVRFVLHTDGADLRTIQVTAWAGGTYLAKLAFEVAVTGDAG